MKRLYALLTFVASSVFAQSEPVTLPSPAVWLEPLNGDVAALLQDSTLALTDGNTVYPVSKGWMGNSLLEYNSRILGNYQGQLAVPETDLLGPKLALYSHPAYLENGNIAALADDGQHLLLLDETFEELTRAPVQALPDAEIVTADLTGDGTDELVFLTDPTERYPHGVLGDGVEAASVSVFDTETLETIASYTLPENYVFEQRRVLPFDLGDKDGLLATRSSEQTGAGVVLLEFRHGELQLRAEAQPIGTGFRWLNLFAARDGAAYAVRTPHIGGPFKRYTLRDSSFKVEQYDLGVTNHTLGSRNLDLGVLLPSVKPDTDHLVLPSQDLRTLKLIRCTPATCEVINEFELGGRLSSNVVFLEQDDRITIVAGDETARLHFWQIMSD